jgi:hypothetical protein
MTTSTDTTTNGTQAAAQATPDAAPSPPRPAAPAPVVAGAPLATRAPALPPPAPDQGGTIDAFASAANFAVAQRMAQALSVTTMVPDSYKRSFFEDKVPNDRSWEEVKEAGNQAVGNCMIAIELASRIGASVFAVMQNLDIIHGKPGFRSAFLIATVNSCGRFSALRWRFEGKPGTDEWGARAVAKDRETGEECLGTLVTIGMAKAEGWYQRSGSKWKTLPEQMLCYRSAAFWTRLFAPELSLGMSTSDEIADFGGSAPPGSTPTLTPVSVKTLEQQLLAREPAAAMPPSPPSRATADAVVEPVVAAAGPAPPAGLEKPAKKSGGKAGQATLPTGNLLPVEPAKAADPERDPVTGELVPPMREPGDDTEELT